jgi:arylsulfatase A-like enzyme/HEAT repeat protein
MLRRLSIAATAGTWAGALAGLAVALGDYGAHWLYMESAEDRIALATRLLCLLPAFGAALGALGGAWCALTLPLSAATANRLGISPQARRAQFVTGALWALPLLWPLAEVARLLWSGGMMSRLPLRTLGIGLTFAVLAAGTITALALVLPFWRWLEQAAPKHRVRALFLIAATAFSAAKLNQHVLPNLYDYLHGLLTVLSATAFGVLFALIGQRWLAKSPVRTRVALVSGAALFTMLAVAAQQGFSALDRNQNVRVALLNPNMPNARSLMLGVGPFLPEVDHQSAALAKRRAEAARQRRNAQRRARDGRELPVVEDAHVLLITVDALRSDRLGIHGYARNITPALDAIAQRGVSFDRAYAQAPHSSYSLCSLMTSEYLHETLELGQPAPTATLPSVLAQAGYHTAAFYTQGIFHTAGEQLQGFQDNAFGFALHDHQDRPAEEMTDRVLREVDRTLARKEPSTLFWVHYFDVHEPYEATTLGTSDSDRYDSELLATDAAIGRLVREAQKRLTKPLIVVITADHGEEFHDHGGVYHGSSLYEEQVRVPLILVAPQLPAARIAAPVESVDIAPTLLGLLGVDVPSSMRGHDLRGLALGSDTDRGPVFSAVIHKKMVVRWPYKLVADLRFGLYELYDLEHDPRERDNRADRDPQRLDSLRGEVYAWLDSLAPRAETPNASAQALEWGRLGDRRAVKPLAALVLNDAESDADRSEAARLLGKLADPTSIEPLLRATELPAKWVAAEAAIALGRMFEPRAAPALRQLIAAEDPGLRSRAAVSLGRLRDKTAVPSLIDALWMAPNMYEREEAVRWLGRLGDSRAIDPLLNLLPEAHVRHLVVVALGEIGDPRAYAPLLDVLTRERNASVRDGVVRGLAMLGDPRAIDAIMPLATEETALQHPSEALVRLHALEAQRIGGADLQRTSVQSGFGKCQAGPIHHDWNFLHRTVCFTQVPQASLRLRLPAAVAHAPNGSVVLLSLRRTDSTQPTDLELTIGDHPFPAVRVDGAWSEERWSIPADALRSGDPRATLRPADPRARFEVDHVLIVPRPFNAG